MPSHTTTTTTQTDAKTKSMNDVNWDNGAPKKPRWSDGDHSDKESNKDDPEDTDGVDGTIGAAVPAILPTGRSDVDDSDKEWVNQHLAVRVAALNKLKEASVAIAVALWRSYRRT
jgi:hypothetical protein